LIEMIAESDETLMEAFLEEGTLNDMQLRQGLIQAVAKGAFFPVVCCSSTNLAGI
jgi:elongation factor G